MAGPFSGARAGRSSAFSAPSRGALPALKPRLCAPSGKISAMFAKNFFSFWLGYGIMRDKSSGDADSRLLSVPSLQTLGQIVRRMLYG